MPWGDNLGNNQGGNSPWGGNDNNNRNKNEINNLFKDTIEDIKRMFPGGKPPGSSGGFLFFIILGILGLWLLTGFYKVDEGEQAVVLRFGKYVRSGYPGLNYHFPEPFESMIKERVEEVRLEQIGFRANAPVSDLRVNFNKNLKLTKVSKESLMLTGDQNIVDINFVVQWKIKSLKDYVFNVANQIETVKDSAESAMREIVGNTTLIKAITKDRSRVEAEAKNLLQRILDNYNSGIEVTTLVALKVDAPSEVIDSFRDVQTAKADKERLINQAEAYRNDIIPRARGAAAKIIQEAEGYKQEVELRALGETNRFDAVYEKYRNAKDITKKRIYIESMEEILRGIEKVIIDNKQGNGVVPYLPLPNLGRDKN